MGGVARTREVIELSSSRRLRTALARGDIVRLSRGWLGLPSRERAERAARSHDGVVSHASAALLHGWPVVTVPDLPQVTVPIGTPAPDEPDEVAEVFQSALLPRDIHGMSTSPLRTVIDCAHDLAFHEALAIADSALREESVSRETLLEAATRCSSGCRCRQVAAYADEGAANPFESVLRAHCISIGLAVVTQWEVRSDGMTLHPDLANPLLGIAAEADSYTHHGMEKVDFVRDVVRYNALVVAGWLVLRFTYEQVMNNPGYVQRLLRWAVARQRSDQADTSNMAGGPNTLS